MIKWPEPWLFVHALLNHNTKNDDLSDCVWLGVTDRDVCEKAYAEGETSKEIRSLYTEAQLKQAVRDALEEAAKVCLDAIKKHELHSNFVCAIEIRALIKEIDA